VSAETRQPVKSRSIRESVIMLFDARLREREMDGFKNNLEGHLICLRKKFYRVFYSPDRDKKRFTIVEEVTQF
jgi:hypothetical protein